MGTVSQNSDEINLTLVCIRYHAHFCNTDSWNHLHLLNSRLGVMPRLTPSNHATCALVCLASSVWLWAGYTSRGRRGNGYAGNCSGISGPWAACMQQKICSSVPRTPYLSEMYDRATRSCHAMLCNANATRYMLVALTQATELCLDGCATICRMVRSSFRKSIA